MLTPAYGRDYKSSRAVEADFRRGVDFVFRSYPWSGAYCSIRDFQPGVLVELRYDKNQQVALITV